MFTLVFALMILAAWMVPGAVLARGIYSSEVKAIRSKPVQIVPPRPERPLFETRELLHDTGRVRCQMHEGKARSCNCSSRNEWAANRKAWRDYYEWENEYGHIKNGVVNAPTVNTTKVYSAILFWPPVLIAMYVQGGAESIPDYREIERMEKNLLSYDDDKFKELE